MNSNGFMPHGYCFLWRPDVLWLQIISDSGIAFAYYSIPVVLIYFMLRRRDLPFPIIIWLFCAFILLCGASHIMSIWVIWHPDYYVEGWIKAATAIVSLITLGTLIYILPRALDLVGTVQLAALNARLTTMIEASEERGRITLGAVMDNVFDGIITISEQGLITSFNATCSRLFGYQAEEVIGRNISMLMPAPYQDAHDQHVKNHLDTGISKIVGAGGREVAGLRQDGTVFPLDLSVTSFTVGGVRHFTGCLRDITTQKAALEVREQLLARLAASNTELERFAYVASHDMQEPARMMLTFSQLLSSEYADRLDEEGQEYLKIIGSSALRMRDMIRDLMDYARLDGVRQSFTTLNLSQTLTTVEENLRQVIDETGAILTCDPLPDVTGSAVQLMRLLQNLVNNAIKYQPAGQVPRIHLGVTQENGETAFFVQDNGIGIPPAFIDEIFQPFRRLHTWDAIQGTGLGLAVCRKIVETHGGRIWATSRPGQGTKICFTLPE